MFCFSNETSSGGGMLIWLERGFTFCFYDTLSTSILFGFIFIFGLVQYVFYRYVRSHRVKQFQFFFYRTHRRFGFRIEREYIDASILYSFQVVLTILLACEPILLYATEITALGLTKVKQISLNNSLKYRSFLSLLVMSYSVVFYALLPGYFLY